ncbi:hypothetical protein PLIIFM63780_009521 [Purpureocillium lilacinum]|nr:hypothetical protein PLIIFM63780_009521 [Purpureocillium lilacinum]
MAPPMRAALFLLLAETRLLHALQVTPGSHCATYCLDSPGGNPFKASDSTTNTTDISCRDRDYSTTDKGIKFKTCLDCLQNSSKVDKDESDLKWYIYNLRYALATCLFAEPHALPNYTLDSTCNIDQACKPLKDPLTADGFDPVPKQTSGYCTANDGTFMGSHLSSCISCLQATEGQVYLSNFMIALQAGCQQDPQDGSTLNLSGSVFTTSAVNMTSSKTNDDQDKGGSLPPSAIAGIVVGIVLIFLAAICLFAVHWRREKTRDAWDDSRYFDNYATTPGLYGSQGAVELSKAQRRYFTGTAFGEKESPFTSSGEYYDYVAAETSGRCGSAAAGPRAAHRGRSSALPTHAAYNPNTVSRNSNQSTTGHHPLAPPAVHRPSRSNTPDSFAVQAYLNAAQDSANLVAQQQPIPTAEPKPRSSRISKIPSLALASLPKLRVPKRHSPPKASGETLTPGGVHRGHEMHISRPVSDEDPRFLDRPIGGPVVTARERPPHLLPPESIGRADPYMEVPLRSGKSTLYGY